ncbi:hypothetical protein OUQ99_08570 [Streptomonospora nanhaiensis]|uniref:DUF2007 domain-containing protein n=1 Tax=Streptomonospora nanhaiensis TaxID=1323731 RepID=A0ABY6YRZ1_9ACTN|nr:hypothetical protein [Streptomonospora nanhaiensis]WAE75122.1 hypothetical protein OUQ99_08570 [Streptomonospora nanhaiensis]
MTQRRGNGLLADAYVPLILLAPSHADTMLEALRRSGIAAYAVPLNEDVLDPSGGGADDPPTDHLYVDAEERAAAERVLGAELPDLGHSDPDLLAPHGDSRPEADGAEGGAAPDAQADGPAGGDLLDGPLGDPDAAQARSSDEDHVWNDLVARFYDEDASDRPTRTAWPDAENLGASDRREDAGPGGGGAPDGDLLAGGPPDAAGEDDEDEDEDARRRAEAELEGHYEPPPPPPLLKGDRVGIAAWFGLLGGPVLVFGAAFAGISLPNWMMFLAVVAFLASFVVLILRMTDSRPPGDNGPDNGAVV